MLTVTCALYIKLIFSIVRGRVKGNKYDTALRLVINQNSLLIEQKLIYKENYSIYIHR